MKKAIGVFICLCLGGCTNTPRSYVIPGPSPGTRWPYQDTAPWPWISVWPSKRAAEMKNVDFNKIAHLIRYEISYGPHENRFRNVSLILIDYGILPASPSHKNQLVMKYEGQQYSKQFKDKPERYVMKVSFFEGNVRPPETAAFEQTTFMSTKSAAPQEAFSLMSQMIIQDFLRSPIRQVVVDIN